MRKITGILIASMVAAAASADVLFDSSTWASSVINLGGTITTNLAGKDMGVAFDANNLLASDGVNKVYGGYGAVWTNDVNNLPSVYAAVVGSSGAALKWNTAGESMDVGGSLLFELYNGGASISSITNVQTGLTVTSPGGGAKYRYLLMEVNGTVYRANNYNATDLMALRWKEYTPADESGYVGGLSGATDATNLFSGTETVTKLGFYAYAGHSNSTQAGANSPAFIVEAIPEPATLGMVAAVGGGLLFIRRRFMM